MNSVPQKKIYCFDTSAFLALSRTSETVIRIPDELWNHLENMMKDGEIISHRIVFDEIISGTKNPPFITLWIRKKVAYFFPMSNAQIEQVSEIVKQFPGLIDYGREKEQADPWLIALAIEKSKNATLFEICLSIVVSQENPNSSIKIPAVCKYFNIKHCSLREFFDEIGLSTKLSKK
ncbi:MAG: DUF4411 family protein [Patescibacteria group bacterium]